METGHLESRAFPPFIFGDYIETGDVLLPFSPGRFAAAKAVNLHLKCKIRQGPVIYDDAYAPFHVCWHQIRPKNYIDQPNTTAPTIGNTGLSGIILQDVSWYRKSALSP